MKTRLCLLLLIAATIVSCSSSKKATQSSTPGSASFGTSIPKATDDGLTFETAIVITETSEGTGVKAEYAWIREHYSNYKVKKQSLNLHEKKPFDIITITLQNGKDLDLYFDISNFFGKF